MTCYFIYLLIISYYFCVQFNLLITNLKLNIMNNISSTLGHQVRDLIVKSYCSMEIIIQLSPVNITNY